MDITPSPRLLQMLGEIEFDEWQCLAELIDNSLDSFLKLHKSGVIWAGGFKVDIQLPDQNTPVEQAQITVVDTGPGMAYEQLESAVKAGFSSNDKFTRLGLFGMGFNVSTARLGSYTKVETARREDSSWSVVEIDFASIDENFFAPDSQHPKNYMEDHGTRITIAKLKPERLAFLRVQHSFLRQKLGAVYSYILENYPIEISIQGVKVDPIRHCVWDAKRSVDLRLASGEHRQVNAVTQIDIELTQVMSCHECGNTQALADDQKCNECGHTDLVKRDRRIHGWLGVQRYMHTSNFGIDFLRNGRKILINDKRLFSWTDPSDATSSDMVEYPSELAHQGGRIVGEIHLDHVPVTYSKDAFEYSDKSWRFMVNKLRGDGPIRPQKAKQLGYEENVSPLGLIVRAYAKSSPGLKYLMPGDGSQAIHVDTRTWFKKFSDGDIEYQDDHVWFDAILNHERIAAGIKTEPGQLPSGKAPEDVDAGDIWDQFPDPGNNDDTTPTDTNSEGEQGIQHLENETPDQRITRLKNSAKLITLSGDIQIPSIGAMASVVTYGVNESGKLKDTSGGTTACWVVAEKGNQVSAFVDLDSKLLTTANLSQMTLLAWELARYFTIKTDNADVSVSAVAEEIIFGSFGKNIASSDSVKLACGSYLEEIQSAFANRWANDLAKVANHIEPADLNAMQDAMISELGAIVPLSDPASLNYIPFLTLLSIFFKDPGLYLDGNIFSASYSDIASEQTKFIAKVKYGSLLTDVVIAANSSSALSSDSLQRTLTSLSELKRLTIQNA